MLKEGGPQSEFKLKHKMHCAFIGKMQFMLCQGTFRLWIIAKLIKRTSGTNTYSGELSRREKPLENPKR